MKRFSPTILHRWPSTLPGRTRDWDNNKWGGNHGIWGNNNNVNIGINNNFRHNNNFACRPNYWRSRPWWGAGHCHHWHHGHWGYGWNSSYYRRHWWYDDDDKDFAKGFMWGIGVWSPGNLIHDMGYQSSRRRAGRPTGRNQVQRGARTLARRYMRFIGEL